MTRRYLADTSAWIYSSRTPILTSRWQELVRADGIACCDPIRYELLYSAQSHREFRMHRESLDALHDVPIDRHTWSRALDVFEALARTGPLHHRQGRMPDLLIAAAAERADLPVLHYDSHFDVIAKVTGQPTQWIAPRGSL